MTEKLTAVISNGGKGGRLLSITKKPTPKGYIFFNNRPLISHQLETLRKAGLKKVVLTLDSEKQKQEFESLQKRALIPSGISCQIYISSHKETLSPYLAFDSPGLFFFVEEPKYYLSEFR